ncbi:MAG: hypothetical protein L6Q57_08490 [Alphaproteobacteria bacterium]|nr:hypothetical protein [Alphaproteobacteria bacterium]
MARNKNGSRKGIAVPVLTGAGLLSVAWLALRYDVRESVAPGATATSGQPASPTPAVELSYPNNSNLPSMRSEPPVELLAALEPEKGKVYYPTLLARMTQRGQSPEHLEQVRKPESILAFVEMLKAGQYNTLKLPDVLNPFPEGYPENPLELLDNPPEGLTITEWYVNENETIAAKFVYDEKTPDRIFSVRVSFADGQNKPYLTVKSFDPYFFAEYAYAIIQGASDEQAQENLLIQADSLRQTASYVTLIGNDAIKFSWSERAYRQGEPHWVIINIADGTYRLQKWMSNEQLVWDGRETHYSYGTYVQPVPNYLWPYTNRVHGQPLRKDQPPRKPEAPAPVEQW